MERQEKSDSKQLVSKIVSVNNITEAYRSEMYELYNKYYDSSDIDRFNADLNNKNTVLFIFEENTIIGFTTIANYILDYDYKNTSQKLQIVYSGDTIMRNDYWGNPILSFEWLKFAGKLKYYNPNIPLYWFIIVKGHRTYRYLPVFSNFFYPNYKNTTPDYEQTLLNYLAAKNFGKYYLPELGIVHFPESKGHLKQDWADIPEKLLKKPDIEFFLNKNPKYYLGDELVCLCELSEENLKPISRRLFKAGYKAIYQENLCEAV